MIPSPILGPVLAQVGLTLVVFLWLFARRMPAMSAAKVNPEKLQRKDIEQMNRMPMSTHFPADNFVNLFEAPVLFFVLCFVVHLTAYNDLIIFNMAWAYVFLRSLHSIIQCTYNKVMHRFPIYMLSSLVLIAMYARISLAYMA
mgnify:CR=1 FL=1|jgi:hypothetical protein